MENSVDDKRMERVVSKFKATFLKLLQKDQYPVIETDFDHERFDDNMDKLDFHNTWYGTFEDPTEEAKCREVANHIENGLKMAREKQLKCEILIPCGLTMKIARDILIMSECEPCGIRGCCLFIHLEEKSSCTELVKVQCDLNTVSTFEVHLTLQEDTRSWCAVKKFILSVTGCFKNSTYSTTPKMLCLGYKLEKQKLYRISC